MSSTYLCLNLMGFASRYPKMMRFGRSQVPPVKALIRRMSSVPPNPSVAPRRKPTNFEKKLLVWTKQFKSQAEIPEFLPHDMMSNAWSKVRIKVANIALVLTVMGCGVAIYLGKSAAHRGETVVQSNIDWHNNYNAEKGQNNK